MTRRRRGELREALGSALSLDGDGAQAERLRLALLGSTGETEPLADEVAAVLADEPFGVPLAELARRLRRRQMDLRTSLRFDARFTATGATRGRRWRLVAQGRRRDVRDGMGRNLPAIPNSEWSAAAT